MAKTITNYRKYLLELDGGKEIDIVSMNKDLNLLKRDVDEIKNYLLKKVGLKYPSLTIKGSLPVV